MQTLDRDRPVGPFRADTCGCHYANAKIWIRLILEALRSISEYHAMGGKVAQEWAVDPLAILGFGFVGLAFLMAYLGYRALKEVIGAPDPKENVIKLARLFMYLSFALLVAAGPLQLALLWAQSAFAPKPVKITISLAGSTWEPASYGEVGIMRGGKFVPFSPEPITATFGEGDEVNVQLDKVAKNIDIMRAQFIIEKQDKERPANAIILAPPASDPAIAAQNAG
jgi:hypothetical protein